MGTSRPYVTKLLDGSNFTLQTMVKLAMALDAVVRIRLEGREEREAERQAGSAVTSGAAVIIDLAEHRINGAEVSEPSPVRERRRKHG